MPAVSRLSVEAPASALTYLLEKRNNSHWLTAAGSENGETIPSSKVFGGVALVFLRIVLGTFGV